MLTFILALGLLLVALLSAVVRKSYAVVPPHELKRQADAGNNLAQVLDRAVSYGVSLSVLLWLILALTTAGGFVLLTRSLPVWASLPLMAAFIWLSFSWLPGVRVSRLSMRLARYATPGLTRLLHYVDKPLQRLAQPLHKHYVHGNHSGLYELQDLLNLLDLQTQQTDSRISHEEIDMIRNVVGFGDRQVSSVMRPRAKVMAVSLADPIGPVLLDELHASGQSSFPVRKSPRSSEIVASLQLADVSIHSKGAVEDYAKQSMVYVHLADNLSAVLHAYYQTKQQMFVVLDAEEAYAGILTLEDILQLLVGHPRPQ